MRPETPKEYTKDKHSKSLPDPAKVCIYEGIGYSEGSVISMANGTVKRRCHASSKSGKLELYWTAFKD